MNGLRAQIDRALRQYRGGNLKYDALLDELTCIALADRAEDALLNGREWPPLQIAVKTLGERYRTIHFSIGKSPLVMFQIEKSETVFPAGSTTFRPQSIVVGDVAFDMQLHMTVLDR